MQQVTAVDGDAGEFGHLTYTISGDGIYNNGTRPCFSVDSGGGTVQVLRVSEFSPPSFSSFSSCFSPSSYFFLNILTVIIFVRVMQLDMYNC